MPRKARIDTPGALHHIIVRGIERKKIFRSDSDRKNFLGRLGYLLAKTKTDCFAWAFIDNHAHLLLRTGLIPIARVMARLLTGYAVSFNRKYRRHGQLFQNRYKSILCQEDPYLRELVRYIHLNPVRAGLVDGMKSLDKYPWSGHSVVMGKRTNDWQNVDYILNLFFGKRKTARRLYRSFVGEGILSGRRPELTGGGLLRSSGGWSALKDNRKAGIRLKGDERILGDSGFVDAVLKAGDEQFERKYLLEAQGYDFEKVVSRVAEVLSMKVDEVLSFGKSPGTVEGRSLLCYWANRELGMTTIELAKRLNLCQSAVSRSSARGEKIAKKNKLELIP
ncbi:MAG: transposase [Desulfobacterales bacterium]|nr:transposase [Desulfobacterales bacterium]